MNAIVMPEALLATAAPTKAPVAATSGRDAIRPFRVDISDAALVDLRNRLAATRLPERETRRACRSRPLRGSSATGRTSTTGARSKRS